MNSQRHGFPVTLMQTTDHPSIPLEKRNLRTTENRPARATRVLPSWISQLVLARRSAPLFARSVPVFHGLHAVFVPASHAPATLLDLAGSCLPGVAAAATPAQPGEAVDVLFRQALTPLGAHKRL